MGSLMEFIPFECRIKNGISTINIELRTPKNFCTVTVFGMRSPTFKNVTSKLISVFPNTIPVIHDARVFHVAERGGTRLNVHLR